MANMALESRRTRPYAPLIGGILIGVAHAARGGAIEHENYSPPLEGCRGGLSPTGRPTPLMPSAPPQRGFSEESSMPHGGTTKDEKSFSSTGGAQGWVIPNHRTHPEGYAFCPSLEGIFRGVAKAKEKGVEPHA